MEPEAMDLLVARSAVTFTARRVSRIEAAIVQLGLRPESAADLWVARRAAAHALARLAALP